MQCHRVINTLTSCVLCVLRPGSSILKTESQIPCMGHSSQFTVRVCVWTGISVISIRGPSHQHHSARTTNEGAERTSFRAHPRAFTLIEISRLTRKKVKRLMGFRDLKSRECFQSHEVA